MSVQKATFNVGDIVEVTALVERGGPSVGSPGIVRTITPSNIGVEITSSWSQGHELHGELPGSHAGWFFPSTALVHAPTYSPIEEDAQQLAKSVADATPVLLLGGKVYRLEVAPHVALEDCLTPLLQQFARQFKVITEVCEARVLQAEHAAGDQHIVPVGTDLASIQRGLRLYITTRQLHFVLPISYYPRFIISHETRRVLSEAHQKQLSRPKLLLDITTSGKHYIDCVFRKSSFVVFKHYHSDGRQTCLSSFAPEALTTIDDVFALRNKIQEILKTINGDSCVLSMPPGLPTKYMLWDDARRASSGAASEDAEWEVT